MKQMTKLKQACTATYTLWTGDNKIGQYGHSNFNKKTWNKHQWMIEKLENMLFVHLPMND